MTNATADPDVQTVDHGPDVVPVPLTTLVRGQRATLCATPPEELDGELLRAMGMRTD